MKISDILRQPLIVPDLKAGDKAGVLEELAQHLAPHVANDVARAQDIAQALLAREQLGSTGVGEGVAIPHAKIPQLRELTACFGRSAAGVAFDAIDDAPVRLIFVLLVPENSAGAHLKALARISRLLKSQDFRDRLMGLGDAQALFAAFIEEDERQ